MKIPALRPFQWMVWLAVVFFFTTTDGDAQNFVYTNNNNSSGGNTVSAFSVAGDGSLTKIHDYSTGGSGNGGVLFPSSRAASVVFGNFLYVGNDGDSTVSGFSINPTTGELTSLGAPVTLGGGNSAGMSLQATPNGRHLYVTSFPLNGPPPFESSVVTCFEIDSATGALTPINSTFVEGTATAMKVSPDGRFLAVSLGFESSIVMFAIDLASGGLTPAPGSPFPAGFDQVLGAVDINCAGTMLFAAKALTATEPARVHVYAITQSGPNMGALAEIDGSPFDIDGTSNSSVAVLSPDDQFLYMSNQGGTGDAMTVLKVREGGKVSQVSGSPFFVGASVVGAMATNQVGTLLYTAIYDGSVAVQQVDVATGALTPAPGSPFSTGQGSGMQSLAAYPPKACQQSFNGAATLATTSSMLSPTGCLSYANEFVINATLTNRTATAIRNPFFRVTELREANGTAPAAPFRLVSADNASCESGGLVGAIQTIPPGNVTLAPGASLAVQFRIALPTVRRFRFVVEVAGSAPVVTALGVGRRPTATQALRIGSATFDVKEIGGKGKSVVTSVFTPDKNEPATARVPASATVSRKGK
jgi:6-phosphogluconolactonase (cycloisomerase 2 family)